MKPLNVHEIVSLEQFAGLASVKDTHIWMGQEAYDYLKSKVEISDKKPKFSLITMFVVVNKFMQPWDVEIGYFKKETGKLTERVVSKAFRLR